MDAAPYRKSLLVAGATLFLLGLLQGSIVHIFLNPRMALSAHLTAVQSGMAIMIAGVIWNIVSWHSILEIAARWSIVAGMYGLWTGLTLSAATGASAALPIAGAGYSAPRVVELGVSVIVLASSAIMILGWLLLVTGLIRSRRS